jgi:hypothetical protein
MPYPGSATNWSALFSRQQPGGYFVAQDMFAHPNNIWFVSSVSGTNGTGYGRSPAAPFATTDYAVSHGDVESGDTFVLMPMHAENLDADSAVDVDVNNLHIMGLGWGGCRPTFTATAIAGDFKLAASCGILENILFLSGVDATTGMLEVSSADWTIRNCEFRDSVGQATDCLITVDGADRLHIHDCLFNMAAGAGANSAIALDGSDDAHIHDCYIHGNFAVGAIDLRTTASNRVNFHDLKIWTANAADICIVDTITASTGFIGPNLQLMLTDNAANITESVTGATFQLYAPVLVCNLAGEQGMAIDWTTSTDA